MKIVMFVADVSKLTMDTFKWFAFRAKDPENALCTIEVGKHPKLQAQLPGATDVVVICEVPQPMVTEEDFVDALIQQMDSVKYLTMQF